MYESFALNGIHSLICKNDGCTAINSTKSASAIFGAQGFSSNGNNGISGGFTVNTAALENYNRVNSDAPIKLGMIVVNPDYLDGKSSFFDENGNVNAEKGVLKIDVDNTDYAKISFSISGFVGEASDISLVIALYAYVDASDIELIQSQTTKCASERVTLGEESLYTVTLNSVKSANSDISKLEEYVMPGKKEQQIA